MLQARIVKDPRLAEAEVRVAAALAHDIPTLDAMAEAHRPDGAAVHADLAQCHATHRRRPLSYRARIPLRFQHATCQHSVRRPAVHQGFLMKVLTSGN